MFYGTTNQGGANSLGIIFQYDPLNNILIKKYDFVSSTGGASKSASHAGIIRRKTLQHYRKRRTNNGGVIYRSMIQFLIFTLINMIFIMHPWMVYSQNIHYRKVLMGKCMELHFMED